MRPLSRKPFIFMNAAGLHSDVVTMAHEAGHAFHSMLSEHEPLRRYRTATEEICEVASMSMELLTLPYLGPSPSAPKGAARTSTDPFYPSPDDVARAKRWQLERSVFVLPWIAQIDAFQHWLYANPTHTREERTRAWLALDDRFGHAISWSGLETIRQAVWQRQLHLFGHPFYYIEYGIAELGSLQLWFISLEQGEKAAIDWYTKGLSLGGSKPLPELFAATGLKFDFGYDAVARLTERVERELEKLPE
jgi:oligoendopeptidase F